MEGVVGASEATVNSVLLKLGGLLAQEYGLIRGVRGDIQYIKDELASMKAFLLDLARDDQDNRKKDWMKQIRDMAYDCEDCIDNFAHRLPNDSSTDGKCCPWFVTLIYDLWTCWPRREIASSVAELKVRAQLIAERRIRYGVENPNIEQARGPPDAFPYDIAEDQLASRDLVLKEPVGVKAAIAELEKWVNQPTVKERAVLSIVGFGGVGKTTIATELYKKVINEFECRAWVTVSQNYDQGAVLNAIMQQIKPDHRQQSSTTGTSKNTTTFARIRSKLNNRVRYAHSEIQPQRSKRNRAVQLSGGLMQQAQDRSSKVKQTETTGYRELEDEIRWHLQGKRYIILVDDIWSAKTWESISRSFPENKNRSRIIVTSRFHAVGATCCNKEKDRLYPIGFLSPGDSEELFKRSVSESRSSKQRDTTIVHEDLWKRCGGQPLAIVTMAGLVACNQSQPKKFWDELLKLLPEQETSTTYGAWGQVNSLTLDGVKRILDSCYSNLPGDLKTCLLYLSIFPKGWKISRKCLCRKLIAEGFVTERQGLTEEEVAETYVNQLLRRNLIRPVDHGSTGRLKTFRVHDMVLDYIVSKAREENFITLVGGHLMMPAPSSRVRRLSIQSSSSSSKHVGLTKGINLSQVRSLTVFGSLTQLPVQAFNCRIIQALDFQGLEGLRNKHLKLYICKMLMLKYLSLRGAVINELPSAIGELEYLETLDIRETNIEVLPKSVDQLKRISSILGGSKNPRKGLRLPQEKSKQNKSRLTQHKEREGMKELRILSGIEIDDATAVAGLHQLTGLKKLTIYKLNILKKDTSDETENFLTELLSSIEYLCSCGLQTLAINDEDSDFINSLDSMSAPPRYLVALELSGIFERPPKWITKLQTLNKLTLSVTVLRTDTLDLLCSLPLLFSLTFSFIAAKQVKNIDDIIERNKSQSGGEVVVLGEGFKNLRLLRLSAPRVPKLSFSPNAMPALEIIEIQFKVFEGLFGIDTLQNLRGVHLREAKTGKMDDDAEINKLLVDDLKNSTEELKGGTEGHKVIVDHTFI